MSQNDKKSKQTNEVKASKTQSDYQSGKNAKVDLKDLEKNKKSKK